MTGTSRAILAVASLLHIAAGGKALAPEELETVQAYEQVASSVVLIRVEGVSLDPRHLRVTKFHGTGSGFAVKPGLVITNYHVIEQASRIEVVLSDNRSAAGVVVGTAPGYDLALLRVPFDRDRLPPAALGSARGVRVGQKVAAVSNPMGLQHSVTAGIISGLNRELPGLDLGASLLQFDAPINPGQSGGPLVDSTGRVIGVTTAKMLGAEAIGFAIPIDIVERVVPDLERMGHTFQPQLGFDGIGVDPDLARIFDLPVDWGVLVQAVEEGSLAAKLGLEPGERHVFLRGQEFILGGDIIVGVDETPIRGPGDLVGRLIAARPGQDMTLSVIGPAGKRILTLIIPEMRH